MSIANTAVEAKVPPKPKQNTFTIVLNTWNRASIIGRAINSIIDQTYPNWELIVVDDGSTDSTPEILKEYAAKDKRIKIITHEKPRERIIAWKHAFAAAKNEWICHIDSDDEYIYGYLEIMNYNINTNPDYKIFHFAHLVTGLAGSMIKPVPKLEEDPEEGWGMKHFDTGKVMGGAFIFHRDCLKNMWVELPEIDNIFDLSDWFGEEVKKYWKERKLEGPVPKYNKGDRWCGNPWGNDYVMSWLITRRNKTKCLFLYLYITYVRTEPWLYERSTVSGTMGV